MEGVKHRKTVGYLHGHLEHHLDHIAPFCSLQGYDLIVTEEELYTLATRYYPDLKVVFCSPVKAPFLITEKYDVVITTLPRPLFDDIFLIAELTCGKRLKTCWLPHGYSDKGNLEALRNEETLLVYNRGAYPVAAGQEEVALGNFRAAYFQKHHAFYTTLLNSMKVKESFVLYAPTWGRDLEEEVVGLPDILIKPHPNDAETPLALHYKERFGMVWLDHFPPVYPLLERAACLVTDASSIAYDFLYFNRPLFFLTKKETPIHACGEPFSQAFKPQEHLQTIRSATYAKIFGATC